MSSYTVKFVRENPMLCRKQANMLVSHPGGAAPSKEEAKGKIAKALNVKDPNSIVIMDMKTVFGGGKTKCLALAYENIAAAKKYDKAYRLLRMGIETEFAAPKKPRRARKDLNSARRKTRGSARSKLMSVRTKTK
eukprot:GHVH01008687.1.p1 GENE.GHVH01008687.1~~GHVH01008687.1.p1  ORF type:complete len:135 (+),score=19.94 GHVH01008687.1:87-491(+)